MNVQPEAVASYIPHFLPLYTDIVLSMDVARMHAMRSKTRLLIVRLLARVLSCHVYKQRMYGWEERLGRGHVCLKCPCVYPALQSLPARLIIHLSLEIWHATRESSYAHLKTSQAWLLVPKNILGCRSKKHLLHRLRQLEKGSANLLV